MTINLTDLKAKAEAATPGEWRTHPVDDTVIITGNGSAIAETQGDYGVDSNIMESNAAYIAAASPAAMLPLIDALIEWRDAQAEYATQEGLDIGSLDEAWFRLCRAQDALLALIGGKHAQETNNDAE